MISFSNREFLSFTSCTFLCRGEFSLFSKLLFLVSWNLSQIIRCFPMWGLMWTSNLMWSYWWARHDMWKLSWCARLDPLFISEVRNHSGKCSQAVVVLASAVWCNAWRIGMAWYVLCEKNVTELEITRMITIWQLDVLDCRWRKWAF